MPIQQDHGQAARNHSRPREDLLVHRCALATRCSCGSETHEAGRWSRHFSKFHRNDEARNSEPYPPDVVHCRLSRGDGRRTSNCSATLFAPLSSTGSEYSPTPTKKVRKPLNWRKVRPARDRAPAQKADVDSEADQPQKEASRSLGSSSTFSCEGPRTRPTCCGKAAPRCMPRKLTERFT